MQNELAEYGLGSDPLKTFLTWYEEAKKNNEDNPEAMTLSTIDTKLNRPNSRTVLFKGMVDQNLVFYTNYLSHKGHELEANNEVSLLFYWHKSIRQVRIQGRVTKAPVEVSDKYFHSRDRDSQLASYISNQSSPIDSKAKLVEKLDNAKKELGSNQVPRPSHWGGYLVEAYEFEFFIYGKNRLNDRFLFEKNANGWSVTRLQP